MLTSDFCFITQVLELDSRNVKALYRRAQAYLHLVDLDLAEMDIKKALEIEPNNRYAFVLKCDQLEYIYFISKETTLIYGISLFVLTTVGWILPGM